MRRPFPALLLLLLAGCVGPRIAFQRETLALPHGTFVIEAEDVDARTLEMLERSLHLVSEELTLWGGLRVPVTLHVLPDRERLLKAVGKQQGWITAWARFDTVHLQSPRTWSLLPPRQSDVDRMLLHELTHSLLYQRAATADTWRKLSLPLWFDEGMASYTAQQAYRWPGLEDLARWYEQHPTDAEDPLRPSHALYTDQHHLVYGAAHHAFTFLVERYGRAPILALMEEMQDGADFETAFERSVGLSCERFEQEFRRYVRLRGFRRTAPRAPPPAAVSPAPRVDAPATSGAANEADAAAKGDAVTDSDAGPTSDAALSADTR